MSRESTQDQTIPRAYGDAVLTARLRVEVEDFRVDEDLGFEPSGEGEQLFLQVEKRGANTAWVADQLAAWAGVARHAVSYAGLKDRHAVTRQAFTVHLPGREAPPLETMAIDGVTVLSQTRHRRKLPRGALRGNRFRLLLRDVAGDLDAIEARLRAIRDGGVPNAFGEQRFGRGGDNVEAARAMFAGKRVRRDQRSMLLSAVRSQLFNQVLSARVADGSWNTGLDGEIWMLDGRHSVFGPEALDDTLRGRATEGDIHPTGPLWGRGELSSADAAREREGVALSGDDDLREGLEKAGLKQERRALRVGVRDMLWSWPADDQLLLDFALPAGSYATVLLAQLGEVVDVMRPAA